MEKWNDLAGRMCATGKYYEPRLSGKLLAGQFHGGRAVARMCCTSQPWRVTAYVALWKTPDPAWTEVGSLYVEQPGNGTAQEILSEVIAKAPDSTRLFIITPELGVMKKVLAFGFRTVGKLTLSDAKLGCDFDTWARRVGLRTGEQDRIPLSAQVDEVPDLRRIGRWLFVR